MDINDIVTLDNGLDYVISAMTFYDNKPYFLLFCEANQDILVAYLDNDEFVESSNKEFNSELLPLFYESVKDDPVIGKYISMLEEK